MKIRSVKIEFGFTKNLGNFESLKISEQYEIELSEKDNLEEVKEQIYCEIKKSIKSKIESIKSKIERKK